MTLFNEIYEEQSKKVFAFLMSLTGNKNEAEELLQETFYQVFLHIKQFEGRSSLYTWICQIAKNAWYKECKRKLRFDDSKEVEIQPSGNGKSPEEITLKKEQFIALRKCIMNLDEPYRDVFILHIYGDVKLKEIANTYGKSESWAKVTYFRGKTMIMEAMKNEGYM